jgi:UDP-2,3-diacylglucosamine hydrolase
MATPAYFISDVHLTLNDGAEERKKRQLLSQFFQMVHETEGTLFIVGDFFDFWFEHRHVIPMRYYDIICQLRWLQSSGVTIHFILGNHDYWTDGFLEDTLGIQVYPNSADIDLDGTKIHLTHGDGLLAKDGGYRLMRKVLRSRITVTLYRWLHPDLGIRLAQSASGFSRKYNQPPHGYVDQILEELTGYARSLWDTGSDIVVMGHYHLNHLFTNDDGKIFLCLGDWISHYSYGKLTDSRLTLESWPTGAGNDTNVSHS